MSSVWGSLDTIVRRCWDFSQKPWSSVKPWNKYGCCCWKAQHQKRASLSREVSANSFVVNYYKITLTISLSHQFHVDVFKLMLIFVSLWIWPSCVAEALSIYLVLFVLQVAHKASTRAHQRCRSAETRSRRPHVQPFSFISLSTVLLQVSLGRPLFLWPSGVHRRAILVKTVVCWRSTCPIHRQRLRLTWVEMGGDGFDFWQKL